MLPTFLSLIVLFIWQTDIRNWIRNIEKHASDNVNKILVGNKADTDESKRVSTQAPLILLYDLLIL
jgi:GTPase SAR1 family protein